MILFKRYIFQVLLWLGIWCMLWLSSGGDLHFTRVNAPTFVLQVLLLFMLVYLAVPKLLFKKKYLYFFISTVPIILFCAFISAELDPPPPFERPHPPEFANRPTNIPTRFFVNLLMLSISSVTAVLIETFVFAQKKEKSIALAKAELMENELKFLKMQINPHFLFNALNNIYALSVTNSNKTQESISTLSEMLRYVIYDCENAKVPLQKELDYIDNYIALFKLKSSKPFNITFTKNISSERLMVAPMVFLPYIENAFKHSGIEKGENHFISISLTQDKNTLEFLVENSIPSMPISSDAHGGIGLPNVQKRLEILYGENHELTITKANTFKVHLKLKMQ